MLPAKFKKWADRDETIPFLMILTLSVFLLIVQFYILTTDPTAWLD